jgi:hypothetical protein
MAVTESQRDASPIVRSLWQQRFRPDPGDPGLGGDSPSTTWGAANVKDKPLSAGGTIGRRSL